MKLFKFLALSIFMATVFLSCKKTEKNTSTTEVLETPLLRKDNLFPNGILQFNSKESVNEFYHKGQVNSSGISALVPKDFLSLKASIKSFENSNSKNSPTVTGIPKVGAAEFINDFKINLVDDEDMQSLLNEDLQVIVGGKLYQETRIGTFVVDNNKIAQFLIFFETQKNSILFNFKYISTPNEIPISKDKFQVMEGVVRNISTNRMESFVKNIPGDRPAPLPIDGGSGGGGGTTPPPCSVILPTNFLYENHTVNTGFSSENTIFFDDRCYTFKTQNINFLGLVHQVDIKGKLQRKKSFLGISYWGPSYADENIVGCDNMDLETDYIFPYPQTYNTLSRPNFTGVANFSIGNNTLATVGIDINIKAIGYSLTNSQVTSFINHQYNKIVGNVYENAYTYIENNIIGSIDPSYITQYQNYTKMIKSLDDQHRLKWIIGKTERYQDYSHENHWTFDWHVGFGSGNSVNYTMKAGSFYGRIRVGCNWYGIRTVVIPD